MKTEKPIIVKRLLPCVLTETEKMERGRQLADLEYAKAEIERAKKTANDRFKDELTATELAIEKTTVIVRAGEENRDVECEWRKNWDVMIKSLIRLDTGEIVETAAIREEERQRDLPIVEATTCSECPDPPICRDSSEMAYCEKHRHHAIGSTVYLANAETPAEAAAAAAAEIPEEDDDKSDNSHINRGRKK